MYKHKGLEKCNVLVGRVDNNKEAHIKRLHEKLADTDLSPYARQRAQKSLKYWETAPGTYSFIFEGLDES